MTQPPPSQPGSESWGPVTPQGEPDPEPRPRSGALPLLIGAVVLVLVLSAVLVVAFLTARTGPSGQPTDAPSSPPPPLVLPLAVDDLSRDPNADNSDTTIDTDIETVSATYNRAAEPNLVVIAGRPVAEPAAMLELVQAEALRPIEDGLCGRDPSGYDVCVVMRGNTAVLGLGIAMQPLPDLLDDTQAVAAAMNL
ncbi:hypothetical protein [Auraticoccus monumenti]|uniref:Uncharacterized protein n=1 Tax=Auraticoccus monumenti TaxID=675864 RepID=A0A1G6U802_9ACTN|nr:hypothetical protein [Auraticoccus monumenti]SDD37510.1 hypothetical protein SAMN04489747_0819 [Auraticoccus monumenti]